MSSNEWPLQQQREAVRTSMKFQSLQAASMGRCGQGSAGPPDAVASLRSPFPEWAGDAWARAALCPAPGCLPPDSGVLLGLLVPGDRSGAPHAGLCNLREVGRAESRPPSAAHAPGLGIYRGPAHSPLLAASWCLLYPIPPPPSSSVLGFFTLSGVWKQPEPGPSCAPPAEPPLPPCVQGRG